MATGGIVGDAVVAVVVEGVEGGCIFGGGFFGLFAVNAP